MNDLETCSNECGSIENSKNNRDEDYTNNSKYADDDLKIKLEDNDNSILSSSNQILNEKQIKKRIHPPSQHLNDHIF